MPEHNPKQDRQALYLKTMGIQAWLPRSKVVSEIVEDDVVDVAEIIEATGVPAKVVETAVEEARIEETGVGENVQADVSQYDWPDLQVAVSGCIACSLHNSRTNTVFGNGDRNADVMVIGEAPGADEDEQGEPFVGKAGKLLNNMLQSIGYQREQVYVANILKCQPPNNRDPQPDEVAQCESYLKRQITLVKPRVILAVGRIAAHNLLKVETPVGRMRGKQYQYNNTPVVVTYHPAYLLRKPSEKSKSWDDLRFALSIIQDDTKGSE